MTAPKKTLNERILEADFFGNKYLGDFNELDEAGKGHTKKAQELYRKGQFWLDRYNLLTGNGAHKGPAQ
jgi:hypothetical protein